jgi:hypothetical protein
MLVELSVVEQRYHAVMEVLAGIPIPPVAGPVTVQRIVSSGGGITVARQRVQVGRNHARKVLTVTLDETTIQVHDGPHLLLTAPRTTSLVVRHTRAQHH